MHKLKVGIVLASAGRPELLATALEMALGQDYPAEIVVSVPDVESLPSRPTRAAQTPGEPAFITALGARGLSAQRNAGMRCLPEADLFFFFDDDAVVHASYVSESVRLFEADEHLVAMTGVVLADGAAGREIPHEEAVELLAAWVPTQDLRARRTRELYGCNFAVRSSVAREELFDERLPLYSWLEDHDFARRVARHGDLVIAPNSAIVHRGAKSGGRMAHERLGYSQVMNPWYLWRKGSFSWNLMLREAGRPFLKNHAFSLFTSETKWRRERVSGNWKAVADICRGRVTPERIRAL